MIPSPTSRRRGSTLVESVIAIGVLAVAIPMVFGTLTESGKSGLASQAETRSSWIVPACMDEIRASREGRPQYFTATDTAQPFPAAGDVWALAFSADGKPVGKLTRSLYDKGLKELNGKPVRYIATMAAVKQAASPMLRVDILLEYPSNAKAEKRAKLDFHTRIP
jgi:hypothetical protein